MLAKLLTALAGCLTGLGEGDIGIRAEAEPVRPPFPLVAEQPAAPSLSDAQIEAGAAAVSMEARLAAQAPDGDRR